MARDDRGKDFLVGMAASACVGATVGLAIAIWACVEYIEPAFAKTNGITKPGAQALTALIAIGGELEFGVAAGALAGAIAFCALASFTVCCVCVCQLLQPNSSSNYSASGSSLFKPVNDRKVTQPEILPPVTGAQMA